jgi:hypothetical protein
LCGWAAGGGGGGAPVENLTGAPRCLCSALRGGVLGDAHYPRKQNHLCLAGSSQNPVIPHVQATQHCGRLVRSDDVPVTSLTVGATGGAVKLQGRKVVGGKCIWLHR